MKGWKELPGGDCESMPETSAALSIGEWTPDDMFRVSMSGSGLLA